MFSEYITVPSILHGIRNEKPARNHYKREMQNIRSSDLKVFNSGLVVHPQIPFLGTSPDGKVIDPSFTYLPCGLLEIKCPYKGCHKTLDEKCGETGFYLNKQGESYHLKTESGKGKLYYDQIQGQMALSGLPWCDFVVYLVGSQEMAVERIYFKKDYWDNNMLLHLANFYHTYGVPRLLSLPADDPA